MNQWTFLIELAMLIITCLGIIFTFNNKVNKRLDIIETEHKNALKTIDEIKLEIKEIKVKNHELDAEMKISHNEFKFIKDNIIEIKEHLKTLIKGNDSNRK